MRLDAVTMQRERDAFGVYAKPIARLLADDRITDIMLNAPQHPGSPGQVWIDRAGEGLVFSGVTLMAAEAERLVRAMAQQANVKNEWSEQRPFLSFQAAAGQYRIEALHPPASSAPTFTLRKYVKRDVRLGDYQESGELNPVAALTLAEAAEEGETILIAGETGSGKTTLANALLQLMAADGARRVLVIEDTPELECPAGPSTKIEVNPESEFGYREAVRSALRQRPNAIVLGELRAPDDAVEALRAWTTGHQGLATLHASSVVGALSMLYSLSRQSERGRHTTEQAIADAIQVVVSIRRRQGKREITVGRVVGWDGTRFGVEQIG